MDEYKYNMQTMDAYTSRADAESIFFESYFEFFYDFLRQSFGGGIEKTANFRHSPNSFRIFGTQLLAT